VTDNKPPLPTSCVVIIGCCQLSLDMQRTWVIFFKHEARSWVNRCSLLWGGKLYTTAEIRSYSNTVRSFWIIIEQFWSLVIPVHIPPACSTAFEQWARLSRFLHTVVFTFIISFYLDLIFCSRCLNTIFTFTFKYNTILSNKMSVT
jgi:hypothetical protein